MATTPTTTTPTMPPGGGAISSSSSGGGGIGQPLPQLRDVVYLDHNATTPIYPEVAAAMEPFLQAEFGNASSTHAYGRRARAAVEAARAAVAELVGAASPREVVFTSGGTEADNGAIWGCVMAERRRAVAAAAANGAAATSEPLPHVVTTAVEHPAVLAHLQQLQELGLCTYTAVPVDAEGVVAVADVVAALTPATALVTVMHANNEVGAVQPVADIAAAVRAAARAAGWPRGAPLVHTDAAQSAGKISVRVDDSLGGVDLLTVVGHKMGAPKGVGAMYVRQQPQQQPPSSSSQLRSTGALPSFLTGGGQEGGRRGGTESLLLVVGLGAAARLAVEEAAPLTAHLRAMRDRLEAGLRAAVPADRLHFNGPRGGGGDARRLPNTCSVAVRGLSAGSALEQLASQLAASAGAACHSSSSGGAGAGGGGGGGTSSSMSPVLAAMRVDPAVAVGTLRLSVGRHTTAEDVDRAVALICGAARKQGVLL